MISGSKCYDLKVEAKPITEEAAPIELMPTRGNRPGIPTDTATVRLILRDLAGFRPQS
jgi:hypothetical protein